MTVIGLSLAEIATFLGILSVLVAAATKFYQMFRLHISAPLIEALDKLRLEITQLETYLNKEQQQLKERLIVLERKDQGRGARYERYRVADGSD